MVKLNQNRYLGFATSGLRNKSYSKSLIRSTRPRFPFEHENREKEEVSQSKRQEERERTK